MIRYKKRHRRDRRKDADVPAATGAMVHLTAASAFGVDHKTVNAAFDGPIVLIAGGSAGDWDWFEIDGDFPVAAIQINSQMIRFTMGVEPADGNGVAFYGNGNGFGPPPNLIGANGLPVDDSNSVQIEWV